MKLSYRYPSKPKVWKRSKADKTGQKFSSIEFLRQFADKGGKAPSGFWTEVKNQRKYFDWLADNLGITTQHQWYNIQNALPIQMGARGVHSYYRNSNIAALQNVYSEYEWYPWLFSLCPRGYWKKREHQRYFFDWIFHHYGMDTQEDLYTLTVEELEYEGGSGLLHTQGNSVFACLEAAFPEFEWYPWCCESGSPRYQMQKLKHQRKYIEWLTERLGLHDTSQFYKLSPVDFQLNGGLWLLKLYQNDVLKMLQTVYPEIEWHAWRFPTVSGTFWEDWKNQRKFMDWLGDLFGIETQEQWYSIQAQHIKDNGGSGLLSDAVYGSYANAFKNIYPEYDWHLWLFSKVRTGFWDDIQNLQNWVHWVEQKLNIVDPSDWYKVTTTQIHELNGGTLLKEGLTKHLSRVYPEYPWDAETFSANSTKIQHFLVSILKDLYEANMLHSTRTLSTS